MIPKNCKYLIGIDTGVNTGICLYSREKKKILFLATTQIHKAFELVEGYFNEHKENVFVRIEDARLRKWIPKQKTESAERGRREGAGYVKRDAVAWEDFLKDKKIPFEMTAPKNNKTKLDQQTFSKITGYTGTTSKHSRDSAMLVFGL